MSGLALPGWAAAVHNGVIVLVNGLASLCVLAGGRAIGPWESVLAGPGLGGPGPSSSLPFSRPVFIDLSARTRTLACGATPLGRSSE